MEMVHANDIKKIKFFYNDVNFTFSKRTILKKYLLKLFVKEKKRLNTLTYVFCTDPFLLHINKQYLSHNFFTDILTFDLSTSKKFTAGEIYISIDRVTDNAISYNRSFNEELHRVIFHGALHLCGYNDKLPKEKAVMRKAEDNLLEYYFSTKTSK